MHPSFVVSLDFELMWGLYDSRHARGAEEAVRGARVAIPRMLALFRQYEIAVTWATVGLLWCRSRAEMLERLDQLAGESSDGHYLQLSRYIEGHVGVSESDDVLHFAGDLARGILETPRQEIASHSFSHYCCLEPGANPERFLMDVGLSRQLAVDRGFTCESLVFPRNQVDSRVLRALGERGIRAYRGNPSPGLYRERPSASQGRLLRAGRMLDALLPLCNRLDFEPLAPGQKGPVNVPASRFLRPWSPALSGVYPLHKRRIRAEMTAAAKASRSYHLWWHPHNFGCHQDRQLALLEDLLIHYRELRDRHGWSSACMADFAEAVRN